MTRYLALLLTPLLFSACALFQPRAAQVRPAPSSEKVGLGLDEAREANLRTLENLSEIDAKAIRIQEEIRNW